MEEELSGSKKTRGVTRIIFSRTTVMFLLLALQGYILANIFMRMREFLVPIYGSFTLFGLVVVVYIINSRGNTEIKMAWILPILVIPVFGTLFYLYLRLGFGTRTLNKRLGQTHLELQPYTRQDPKTQDELKKLNPSVAGLTYYLSHSMGYPVSSNTDVRYLASGEENLAALLTELEKAEKFIFMEYFLIAEGVMWNKILDVLERKAKQGVDVRVMYDGICVISLLPYRYPDYLRSLGIQTRVFSPLKPVFETYQNYRDHRKICVIDGVTGFTGGINIGDEYINAKERFGHWKDTAIMLKGDATRNLTLMFLENWHAAMGTSEDYGAFLKPAVSYKATDKGYVAPYGDSPFDHENVGEQVYVHILERAKNYVHIMTPYLILDETMLNHLTFAAKRGVEVIIIMPGIPDKRYAYELAKTYYEELLEANVQIYTYTPGFVHAKMFVSDDTSAVVGTINCDFRSLYLHFECAAFMYNSLAVADVERDFQKTLRECVKVTRTDLAKRSAFSRIFGCLLRIFAPLL